MSVAKGWAGPLPGQPAVLTTDAQGRFTLTGAGRGRVAFLHLEGPGIATADLGVIAGAPADHLAAASRPIRGVVRDKDTGKPLADVSVFFDWPWVNPRYEEPRWGKVLTDKDGRYELLGLAKAPNYRLMAKPAKGQLYFQRRVALQDAPGLGALAADIEMVRGFTVRGKVTDKEGKPVAGATVDYHPLYANPYVVNKVNGIWKPRSEATTGPDGSYALTVLPGQGVIGVVGPKPEAYMPAFVAPKEIKAFFKTPLAGNGDSLSWDVGGNAFDPLQGDWNALVLLEPGEKEEQSVKDVALEAPQERKGRVVGPDGRPITGVAVWGLSRPRYPVETLKGGEFTVRGLNPRAGRQLVFHHKEKNFGFLLKDLRDAPAGPLAVKLQPCGSLSGRLVDADGQPLARVQFELNSHYSSQQLTTGKDGRFRAEGLVPGLEYTVMKPKVVATGLAQAVVEPGKNKDLGDIKVDN